ncbi:hypothetical protein A5634_19825 [Mycobacterium asiaticum]|uniref:Uncharacterized protein n=1 Tax=Mycobacterium asiaticum TaxID=1790 RepID=A0A1A3P8H4_MYCAS|nr:hypothetical protein [Mycobacterium asiaticum]OBK28887.1 hypothetical protein A5634_19825 [Mycobacterium asiaticum]
MTCNLDSTIRGLDAAITEYGSATVSAAEVVSDLLGVSAFGGGQLATTLVELRQQVSGHQSMTNRRAAALVAAPRDPAALFDNPQAAAARVLLRSALRLVHDVGFTLLDEVAVGERAFAAVRSYGELSPLADQLARADHITAFDAARTLGRPVGNHRDFVVRCTVIGLGEALNAEEEPDLPLSVSVETWLSRARFRQQRR